MAVSGSAMLLTFPAVNMHIPFFLSVVFDDSTATAANFIHESITLLPKLSY